MFYKAGHPLGYPGGILRPNSGFHAPQRHYVITQDILVCRRCLLSYLPQHAVNLGRDGRENTVRSAWYIPVHTSDTGRGRSAALQSWQRKQWLRSR